jgi:hypothetical protein
VLPFGEKLRDPDNSPRAPKEVCLGAVFIEATVTDSVPVLLVTGSSFPLRLRGSKGSASKYTLTVVLNFFAPGCMYTERIPKDEVMGLDFE